MENTLMYKRIVSFLLCVSVLGTSTAVYYGVQASRAELALKNQSDGSRAQLVSSLSALETAITKAKYSADPAMRSSLSAEIWQESSTVRACLSLLPFETTGAQEAQKFAAQAGEYARTLIGDDIGDDFETLSQLELAARNLVRNPLSSSSAKSFMPASAPVNDAEYPALIYDGPYSDHLDKKEPAYLAEKANIHAKQAAMIAATATNLAAEGFKITEQFSAKIPYFLAENGDYALEISRAGGTIINMSCGRSIGEIALTREEASQKAMDFVSGHSTVPMKQTYYELADNCVTVNFAATQDDVVLYPDLVKIIVALDTGEIIGIEARGFVMSHQLRQIAPPSIPLDQAAARVSNNLKVISSSLAIIPTSGEHENLCYEFVCKTRENTHCLVYINAQTGKEQNLLLLLESENGTLTA